jgi:phage gpG-like protein
VADLLDAHIDLTAVDQRLANIETRGKRARPAFRELRAPLRADQRSHAKGQQGPNGSWPARSQLTESRRKAHAKNARANKKRLHPKKFKTRPIPKRILGRLPGALLLEAGDLFVKAVSRVPWSGVHQDGGNAGKRAKIPERTFLWLSDAIVAKAREVLLKHVLADWPE